MLYGQIHIEFLSIRIEPSALHSMHDTPIKLNDS